MSEPKSRNFFIYIKDRITGKAPPGAKRASGWRKLRSTIVKQRGECDICGKTKKLEAHHIIPFHIAPELELDPTNVVILCDGGSRFGIKSCHQLFGHLGNFRRVNPNVNEHIAIWRGRLNV